jgi:hypothetical protein
MSTPPQPDIYLAGVSAALSTDKIPVTESRFKISPNPASDMVRFELKSAGDNMHMKVTTADGKVVLRVKGGLSQLNNTLNSKLGSFTPGVYIVQIKDGNEVHVSKLLKQ